MDHMDYVNHMKVGGGDGDLGYYGDGDGDCNDFDFDFDFNDDGFEIYNICVKILI